MEIVYAIENGGLREVKLFSLNFEGNVDYHYPSEFFNENNHQKPEIVIPVVNNLKNLKFQIKTQILASKYVPEQVNAFLGHVLTTITEKLAEDWSSFGITIGKKGKEVNPFVAGHSAHDTSPRTVCPRTLCPYPML